MHHNESSYTWTCPLVSQTLMVAFSQTRPCLVVLVINFISCCQQRLTLAPHWFPEYLIFI